MGGKWTTYRSMGEDLVNKICAEEKEKGRIYPDSLTKGLPLLGSALEGYKIQLLKEKGDLGVQLYNAFGS